MDQVIVDNLQGRRFEKSDNWYPLDVEPFEQEGCNFKWWNYMEHGTGDDAWLPRRLFLLGLDTAEGRPSEMVPLVSVREWNLGWLSKDADEGNESVSLPLRVGVGNCGCTVSQQDGSGQASAQITSSNCKPETRVAAG